MTAKLLFLLAIAPIVLMLSYIHKKDPNPEPKKLLGKVFVFGCLATIPTLIGEVIHSSVFGESQSFLNIFFGVALVEEFFKWIVIYILCYRSKEFDESYDAIVYAAFSSLGFACIENILYVFLEGGLLVGILRAFTAVPGHLCDAVVMGYFIGKARSNKAKGKSSTGYLFLSLLMPTVVHCFYDYFIFSEMLLAWILFFISLIIICFMAIKNASKNNEIFIAPAQTTNIPSIPTQQS